MHDSGRSFLGYSQSSGRARFGSVGRETKALILGERADRLASVAAHSAHESGLRPIVFDLGGEEVRSLSGILDTYDFRSFLYDSFRLVEPGPWHAQLVASAYTAALDLTSEEEAIINSAALKMAGQDNTISPASLCDVLGAVEGFRGFYVDKLKGRVSSLKLLDAADDENFERLSDGNVLVDFHRAAYPLAAELAVALFAAKVVSKLHASGGKGGSVFVTGAHRIFRSSPRTTHGNRLLQHLLEAPLFEVFSSEHPHALSPVLRDAARLRFYSGGYWNSIRPESGQTVLSNSFVMESDRTGSKTVFVPRWIPEGSPLSPEPVPHGTSNPQLVRMILEEVDRFPLTTRESLVQYLSPEFLPADVNVELDDLYTDGLLILEPKDSGTGPSVFAYTVTEAGRRRLEALRR
ncbi:MAG: hypothetical protein HY296_02115 [Thaumarchaeota archaeon]|nr:hypothetical protein [Nitrososphaerota archaeon]